MEKLAIQKRAAVLRCLIEGMSIRATSRITGTAKNTIAKLLEEAGEACAAYQSDQFRNFPCKVMQLDEVWSFVGCREKNKAETSRMMDENAAAYQDGAAASRYGMAPRLSGVDLNGKISAKFDGVDSATGEMVDRKLNVVERPNFVKAALRQSAVAAQNGFTVRWEVPNEAVQAKAQRILSANGIKNIKVAVVPK